MGTLGYMSPEQVKGRAADARSDIFSFGAILYEMLSGSRAFHRDTAAETMSAILREEPPDLSATNKNVQPGLERVVRHCLEKSPEERFHSAHDLAFDLESLSGTSSTAIAAAPSRRKLSRAVRYGAAALAVAAALVGGIFIGRSGRSSEPATFKQLTFRRGTIWSARFGADGKTILSSAAWDGRPSEVYMSTGKRARVPALRGGGRRRGGRLRVRRRGLAPECPLRRGIRESRDAGAGLRGGGRSPGALRESAVGGLFARWQGARHRPQRGRQVLARISPRKGAFLDRRIRGRPEVLAERRPDRLPRTSRVER